MSDITSFRNEIKVSRMPIWLTITTILLGLGFLSLQGLVFSHGSMEMDSWSYPVAWENFKHGRIDMARPPVYAAIIGLMFDTITLGWTMIFLPCIQWCAYIASLQLVWIMNCWFGATPKINAAAVLSMLLIPGFWVLNNVAMAESLSLSGFVLLAWLTGRYIITRRKIYLFFSGVMLLLLVFTKPMFIFLIPILAAVWTYISWKSLSRMLISGVSIAVTVGLLIGYALWMERSHGVFALAIASTHNKYCCLRADGAIIPDEISDPAAREKYLGLYREDKGVQNPDNRYMMEVYIFTWPEIKEIVETASANHPDAEIEGVCYRVKDSMIRSQFFFYLLGYDEETDRQTANWLGFTKNQVDGFIFPFHRYLWFPVWVTAVIWLLFSAIWIYRWMATRRFPAMAFFVSATIFTSYVTAIIGAQDLWGRIMTPVTPLIPVMAASVAVTILGFIKRDNSTPSRTGNLPDIH